MNRQINNFRLISTGLLQKLDICSVYTDYIISIFSMITGNSVFIIKRDLEKKKSQMLTDLMTNWGLFLVDFPINKMKDIKYTVYRSKPDYGYWWLISVIILLRAATCKFFFIQLLRIWFTKSFRNFWFTQLNIALIWLSPDFSALCVKARGLYSIRLRQGN